MPFPLLHTNAIEKTKGFAGTYRDSGLRLPAHHLTLKKAVRVSAWNRVTAREGRSRETFLSLQ